MNLEAAAAGFEHQVVVSGVKLVEPLDVNVERAAPQLIHRANQRVIAWDRRQIVERQVGLADRGKYAGEKNVRVTTSGGAAGNGHQFRKLLLHFAQATIGQWAR